MRQENVYGANALGKRAVAEFYLSCAPLPKEALDTGLDLLLWWCWLWRGQAGRVNWLANSMSMVISNRLSPTIPLRGLVRIASRERPLAGREGLGTSGATGIPESGHFGSSRVGSVRHGGKALTPTRIPPGRSKHRSRLQYRIHNDHYSLGGSCRLRTMQFPAREQPWTFDWKGNWA
jgi:hypothetical protein